MKKPLLILLGIFFFYCLILIYRSSFVYEGTRYFVLFDDMMISMKYAANLAHGYGLVWNAGGEHIEGYTNFLWTIIMALPHLLPIPLEKMSAVIQLITVFLSLGTIYFIYKITNFFFPKDNKPGLVAAFFTAFYYPLINWGVVLGTEVALLAFLLTTVIFLILQKNIRLNLIFVLISLGFLTRTDFIVPAAILSFFIFLTNPKKKFLQGFLIFLVSVSTQTLFRLSYYGDLLPNTYYLKMTGFPVVERITRGLYVTVKNIPPILLVVPLIYTYLSRKRFAILISSLVLGQFLYSSYVGGDAWEGFGGANRYLAIIMPLYFSLFFVAIFNFLFFLEKKISSTKITQIKILFASTIFLLFIVFNTGSDNTLLELAQIKRPRTVGENTMQVQITRYVDQMVSNNSKVAVVWAGIIPYFSKGYFIDLLGKNDYHIARIEAKYPKGKVLGPLQKYTSFWPGHHKWDYPYVLQTYNPDFFAQVYPEENKIYLKNYVQYIAPKGNEFFIHKDAKNIALPN